MRVALNGWFFDQPHVGSGQYIRHLWRELAARPDLTCSILQPAAVRARGPLVKVWWEQVSAPRAAVRQADVLHYPYFAAPLIKPCPVVVTIHDLIPLLFPEYKASPQYRLYNMLVAAAARRADAVIAVSEHTRNDIIAHLRIPSACIHVIYEAATEDFRPQSEQTISAVKHRYGLDRYIFYIGGLNRHKNVRTLLAAYARARGSLPAPCPLVIAGQAHSANPAIFPDVRPMAAALGLTWADGVSGGAADVRFLGFVAEEDKPALYSGASAFVYPSLYEGFGFCPLEAMACGTPVICSRAASLAEIVGDGGWLVEPMDTAAIASALVAVLKDEALAASLRQRGLRQAARFSWAKAAAQTVAVYRSVS